MTDKKLSEQDREDFKMFFAFATNGILSQIPFGVNVDPIAVANAAKSTAFAMLDVQKEAFAEGTE